MKITTLLSIFLLAAVSATAQVTYTITLTPEQATELTNTVRFANDTRQAEYQSRTNRLADENARLLAANPNGATNAFPPDPVVLTEQNYVTARTAQLLGASPGDRKKAKADEVRSTLDGMNLNEEKLGLLKAFLKSMK